MSTAIMNIGSSHIGDIAGTPLAGDAVVCSDDGLIEWIGSSGDVTVGDHPTVLDAAGCGLIPGFIDSHVHITFGDYTPRQRTVGFIESYLHGGTTTCITASEVHVPGRPTDVIGVKALAIAAQRCFSEYRPGGVKVYGGSVILEPGLTSADFEELRAAGVWMAKGGFGAFNSAMEYAPVVTAARAAGLLVMVHTGGGSIPGSLKAIDADALLAMNPTVIGHCNGGPTALSSEDNRRIVADSESALQLSHAGNLRSSIEICSLALDLEQEHRLLISSDTPTGTGMIPLAMLRMIAELVSLGPIDVDLAIAATSGNVSKAYDIPAGLLAVGRPADMLLVDAPVGSMASDWKSAFRIGDLPSVASAITAGQIRFTRSRNTPPPQRPPQMLAGFTSPVPV